MRRRVGVRWQPMSVGLAWCSVGVTGPLRVFHAVGGQLFPGAGALFLASSVHGRYGMAAVKSHLRFVARSHFFTACFKRLVWRTHATPSPVNARWRRARTGR